MDEPLGKHLLLPTPQTVSSTDDVDLAVYDITSENVDDPRTDVGGDVLMVHATGFCAGVWMPISDLLTGWRRAALDVRGHGRSTAPAAGMDWNGTAQDVLATVDALGLDKPFGIGHSMGGASLILAEQARPGTFSGLWVYEPIIFPSELVAEPVENPLATGARRRRAAFDSAAAALQNFASKPPFNILNPDALWAYVKYGFEEHDDGSVSLRCHPEVEAQTYEMGSRHHAFEHLDKVRCPVTVLRGEETFPGPASLAPLIVERLPHGTLEEHPELGHFGPLQDPDSMAHSIRRAITAVESAGSAGPAS